MILQDKNRISINHKIKRIKNKQYKQDKIELSKVHQCKNKMTNCSYYSLDLLISQKKKKENISWFKFCK